MVTSFSSRLLRVSSLLFSRRSCSSSFLSSSAFPSLSASFCFCRSRNFLCARLQVAQLSMQWQSRKGLQLLSLAQAGNLGVQDPLAQDPWSCLLGSRIHSFLC